MFVAEGFASSREPSSDAQAALLDADCRLAVTAVLTVDPDSGGSEGTGPFRRHATIEVLNQVRHGRAVNFGFSLAGNRKI